LLLHVINCMCNESNFRPSPPAPLPKGEGGINISSSYRGGFVYSGLLDTVRELRQKETSAEKIVWHILRNRQFLGLKFRRQHQIGLYIVDFYCDELKLILELDGSIHHTKVQKEKDKQREEYLRSEGFTILRLENYVVLHKPELIFQNIEKLLSPPSPSRSLSLPKGERAGVRVQKKDKYSKL